VIVSNLADLDGPGSREILIVHTENIIADKI
jgi:hypothetical protein